MENSTQATQKTSQQKKAEKPERSRIVMIATNKGGVGKTTISLHICDYLTAKGVKVAAFDPDNANASFARFLTKPGEEKPEEFVKIINIADDTSLDQITRTVDSHDVQVVLVDGVGSQQSAFLNWIDEIALFERKEEMNLDITFIIIVDEDRDTVDQALEVANFAEDNVDYLVVKNLKNSRETTIYEDSPARKVLSQIYDAKEVTLPKMKDHLVSLIQGKSLRLSHAEKDDAIYENDRYRIASYRKKVWAELEKVESVILPKSS